MGIATDATDAADRRLTVAAASTDALEDVDSLFREYGDWVAESLGRHFGITLTEEDIAGLHAAFRAELPRLLGPRGRLLVARLGGVTGAGDPVGVGALLPVDDTTAEIKRMYVRPAARGLGVGRELLARLVEDARAERYATVRLETVEFMTTALAMYREFGFVETESFESEAASAGVEQVTISMELDLA
jgi:ribosomal protein S18 acetylase RimI-like enzyme